MLPYAFIDCVGRTIIYNLLKIGFLFLHCDQDEFKSAHSSLVGLEKTKLDVDISVIPTIHAILDAFFNILGPPSIVTRFAFDLVFGTRHISMTLSSMIP